MENDDIKIPKKKLVIVGNNQEEPEEESERKLMNAFKEYLDNNTFIWDISDIKDFKFNLPQTEFFEEKKMNFKNFEESDVVYDEMLVSDKLTPVHLQEIWEKGQFSVNSRQKDVPYIWQLSKFLHKGRKNINASFIDDISLAIEFFYKLKNRIHYCKKKHSTFNIAGSMKFFFKAFKDLFGLFLGRVRHDYSYKSKVKNPEYHYYNEVVEMYQTTLLSEHPDIDTSIFYPNTKIIIQKIEENFKKEWEKEKILKENELKLNNLTPKEIKETLSELRIQKLIQAFSNSIRLTEKNKAAIIKLIKSEHIYKKIEHDYDQKLKFAEDMIKTDIRKDHPILSKIDEWFLNELEKRIALEKNILEDEKGRRIEKELDEYPTHRAMISSFIALKKNLSENYKLLLQRDKKDSYCIKSCYIQKKQPYPVKSVSYKNYNNVEVTEYSFETYQILRTETSYPFWRIVLTIKRIYEGLRNTLLFCYNYCWNNSFGLKALCYSKIIENYSLDKSSGKVTPGNISFTYSSSLKNLFKTISKSRTDFLNFSDKGFLGSKLGNVMNWIQNYILRLILGLVIKGALYPVSIVGLTLLYFVFTLIGIVFSFVYNILLQFLINPLIYDFDELSYNKCLIFPLTSIFLKRFVWQFALNFIITLFLMIFQIIGGIFMVFFACFRWVLRSIYDSLTFVIIRCNARIPKANTPFAWRIAGPGISRTLFFKMQIDDALLLVKAQLEKLQLSNYYTIIQNQLNKPNDIIDKLNRRVLSNFNSYIDKPPTIHENTYPYVYLLNDQIEKRKKIYPILGHQVRFTKNDLEILLEATYDIVRASVKDNPKMNFIWDIYKLAPLSWRVLTEKILISTFNSEDILIDVDDSELKSDQNSIYVNRENKDLYDKLSIESFKKRANMKMKKLNTFMGKNEAFSLEEDLLEDYYHGNNHATQRYNKNEYENVSVAREIDINDFYRNSHHFYIDIKDKGKDEYSNK